MQSPGFNTNFRFANPSRAWEHSGAKVQGDRPMMEVTASGFADNMPPRKETPCLNNFAHLLP